MTYKKHFRGDGVFIIGILNALDGAGKKIYVFVAINKDVCYRCHRHVIDARVWRIDVRVWRFCLAVNKSVVNYKTSLN